MSESLPIHDERWLLLNAACDDSLDESQSHELAALLESDDTARKAYIEHVQLRTDIRFLHLAQKACDNGLSQIRATFSEPSSPLALPVTTMHGAPGNTFQAWSLAYLVTAVLFGVAVLIGAYVRVSHLDKSSPASPSHITDTRVEVGRITALADCQWSKEGAGIRGRGPGISKTQDQRPKSVYLGDRFAVASGLMEITYDTGAKVILEGPCTYEIDSARGGFLAVGKLTARVEKRAEGGRRRADHYSLSTTHYPLFVVRTPTATVTDLGTEFGVEVEESGATSSHVFQGSVEVRSSNSRRSTISGESAEILHAGESARVELGRNSKVAIARVPGQPNRFVRRIPSFFIPHPSSLSQSPSSPAPRPLPLYRLTDLGTLGGQMSCAYAMNEIGQVVGQSSDVTGSRHAFLYIDGRMKRLETLDGDSGIANGINSIGQVVGEYGVGRERHAFLYHDGVAKDLGTLGGSSAGAYAINDAGQIVGRAMNGQGVWRAFVYAHGAGMKDLGALGGPKAESWAYDINATGAVAGCSEVRGGAAHAFYHTEADGMKDLGTLGGSNSTAFHLNAAGWIVGVSDVDNGGRHAFVHEKDTGIKDLGTLGGGRSLAVDINNRGQIVGGADCAARAGAFHAFVYSDGVMIDLNSRVNAADGWTLTMATDINDSGQIVGIGRTPDGTERAFLLTPVREGRGTRGGGRGAKHLHD